MSKLKYFTVFLIPTIVGLSLYSLNYWSFSAIVFIFFMLPLVELFTKGSKQNMTDAEEQLAKSDRVYDFFLYALLPIQYGLLLYFFVQISQPGLTSWTLIGLTTAMGMSCGVLGINAAHELGHRTTPYEQWMSKALLLSSLYMHFFIEHNRGHHKNVSTNEDPASSRYGEMVYTFYFRSIWTGWLSAWTLERDRLQRKGQQFWSWHNEMLRFQLIQIGFVFIIYMLFGGLSTLCFLGAALIGILLLETVNYIEHYGLRRKKKDDRYERTMPIHSWNSNHPLGRLLLLELSRHSDHHYIASRKYQILRHFDESPQMPTGYPGMMLLSLVPPLWFRVMHHSISKYKTKIAGQDLA